MGRPSNRDQRRAEILSAFARVLADHGYAGATIAAVAAEADITPGLIHHHFDGKAELLGCLLDDLQARFRQRLRDCDREEEPLFAYGDAALKLDHRADRTAARCWVGLFAEAVRDPALFARVRRTLDGEIGALQRRAGPDATPQDAGALLAFVLGSLVLGAFAPRKTAGFAAPGFRRLAGALLDGGAA